jgi:hypothetical protein
MGLNVPSMIRRLGLILALTLCAEAKAEVVPLSCAGTIFPEKLQQTFVLLVDTDKKTVAVGNYEPSAFIDASSSFIDFEAASITADPPHATKSGVSSGSLNRITGEVIIRIFNDGGALVCSAETARKHKSCFNPMKPKQPAGPADDARQHARARPQLLYGGTHAAVTALKLP